MSLDDKRKQAGAKPPGPKSEGARAADAQQPWKTKPSNASAPQGTNARDLFVVDFPDPRFVVDGLIGDGLTVLAGKPKGGKSWLALLLGWAVASGDAVDGRAAWQGEVLYLALEDTQRRLQSRLKKLHADLGWTPPETLQLHTAWPRVDDGGLYHIAEWLEAHKGGARLVIVDVLAKFRKPQKGNGNNYADDYEAVGGLKELVDYYQCSALLLHHTRKLKAEDPFDEISGTYGISGPADTLWMLDNEGGVSARLYVRGRDIAEGTVPLSYTRESGRWVLGMTAEGIDTSGRGDGVKGAATTKLEQCKAWLKNFLKEYAYPSKEIEAAGRVAGFAPSTIRDAKVALGAKGTGEVTHKNYGGDLENDWWSGIGHPSTWKRRPVTAPE